MEMWLKFFQNFMLGVDSASAWLVSTPFENTGISALVNVTPLELMTLTGLIVFIGVAVVKWVIS